MWASLFGGAERDVYERERYEEGGQGEVKRYKQVREGVRCEETG